MPDIGFEYRVRDKGIGSSELLNSLRTKVSGAIKFAYRKIRIFTDEELEGKEGK